MWPAVVITLLAGLTVGYLYAKVVLAFKAPVNDKQIEAINRKLEQSQQTVQLLSQENADLKYQLNEAVKARDYAESQSKSQP